MKLEISNSNYAATVVKVRSLVPLDKLDRLVGFPVFGCQAIVSKETQVGDIGLVFTAETQLSESFCHNNNLFRHKEKNKDTEKTGYFEDNGRVKALKLKGNVSSAFFVSLDSLSYLGIDVSKLKEGDTFTSINGTEICRKFLRKETTPRGNKVRSPKFSRVESKLFPEHLDTENYFKNHHKIADHETVIVTQKLHGTSARFTRQAVNRRPLLRDRIARALGIKVAEREYANLVGTRRTIRDPDIETFYEQDVWMDHMQRIEQLIPKNWVVYGEIIGWAGMSAIQHSYTYGIEQGVSRLFIYRIAVVNEDGISVDLSWQAVKAWCAANGLDCVPELWVGAKGELDPNQFIEKRFRESGYANAVALGAESPVDEGVCVRVEGLTPYVLKIKSPSFLIYESGAIDKGAVDMEELQSV